MTKMKYAGVTICVLLMVLSGCSKKEAQMNPANPQTFQTQGVASVANESKTTEGFKPFLVYADKGSRDNHYVPSGFMPDGKCIQFNDMWTENCHSGSTCIKIVYDVECSRVGQKWIGIYWQNPANNWGNRKGGFDLTGATKLVFWAKGEKGNERIEEFKIGGLTGEYPDSDSAPIGPVFLTREWQKYEIDLRGKDLSYISGGFAWSTNADVNPDGCTFYLDDLRYE